MILTVITPLYNAASTLETLVKSCVESPDIEYLFVDGGSSDGTQEIVPQGTLLLREGSTLFEAENEGIQFSRGDWLYFIGADDQFNADALLKLPDLLHEVPAQFDACMVRVAVHPKGFGGIPNSVYRYTGRQQSMVFRRRVFDEGELFEAGKSDYDNQFINELRGRESCLKLPLDLAWVSTGGMSTGLSKTHPFRRTPSASPRKRV